MHLVLVDDEPAILDVLAAACVADGHDVVSFASSNAALDYLATHRADLLITDIVMPPPDGFRLVSAARKLQPNLLAILVTGYSSRYSLEDMLACGASDLLFKPFRLQELRARVRLAEERQRIIEGLVQRRQALQQASAEMIQGLERELEEARRPLVDPLPAED